MSPPAAADLITVNIDGREIAVPRGTNVIEAAARLGVDVPHYCYHPKLTVVGNCRMCLIEMGMPAIDPATKAPVLDPTTGKQRINWSPKPTIACATTAAPGLHIRTNSPMVRDCQQGVMEFLLINHPLDCPICDQAGECKLQEQSTGYGRGYSRFIEQKNVKPKRTLLGPRVMLDDERCILCSRCIRFSKEVAKDDVLGFTDRGSHSTLTCYPGKRLENNYSLNTVDICPVGALTSTDFRFKMRVWFLRQTNSIDTESSAGANTVVWSREGTIYRITPRENDAVNDAWMADSGRVLYKGVRSQGRLDAFRVNGAESTLEFAVKAAGEIFAGGRVAVVGSGRSTVEEQFLTRRLARALGAQVWLVSRIGEGDGILVSADRNPNIRGALVTGLTSELPPARLDSLSAAIEGGGVAAIVSVGEDLVAAGLSEGQVARVPVVYIGTHANPTSAAARVVMPALTVFEKDGTLVNQQFRIQRFAKAVPGVAGAVDDLVALARLASAAGAPPIGADIGSVWAAISSEVPVLSGVSYASIPDTGLLLDSGAWSGLAFAEGPSLHYAPPAPAQKEAVHG
jgi:NADH-quinone oxidoreductase subunit G